MLLIHHSNNLKKLTQILAEQLQQSQLPVLQAEQILVQNPGMKRWLQQQISLKCGIAANLQFPLPSRFIWDIFISQFDDIESLSAFDGEVLRWPLMRLLQQHHADSQLAVLKNYLNDENRTLNRFQLAEKLAGLYDQYLVYRPQMVQDWEQGKVGHSSTEIWQAYLWDLLRAQNDQPHRAQLIRRLIKYLSSSEVNLKSLPDRLFVFAISAMSPLYLNVLQALAQHIQVHVFNLNPCKHYWGDIQSKKEQLKRGQELFIENELLASLGKQGRDFVDQFYDGHFETVDAEAFIDNKSATLLNTIKNDILHLYVSSEKADFQSDNSIQVVSCYSELRELQVLHDHLLEMFMQDRNLQPHDIVVMCPDINTIAAYVEAVFGQQDKHKKLPFSISDHNNLSSQPVLRAILDWIKLSSSRLTASELLGWLELPALQRKFNLNDSSLETIRYWISSNHIHWGLNAQHKQNSGYQQSVNHAVAVNLNTWLHGINQLLTAYIMNDELEIFADSVAAETVMSQSDYMILGQLQKLLDQLANWAKRLSIAVDLQDWQLNINALIDTFLQLDDDEEWLLKPLRDEISKWQQQMNQANFTEKLDASLIHYILQSAMTRGAAQHSYLSGGINFCNLIPMRTLPFKVVCLIGMGDDKFPRKEIPLQLDLISLYPARGDRSRREDDRYMFLQSLLSAEEQLYISYVGQNKKDDSAIEPSVVVTELLDYVEQTRSYRIPVIKTALQAFSQKNFRQGSYASQWFIKPQQSASQKFSQKLEMLENEKNIELHELIKFFKNPAKYFMQSRLNMSLDEFSDGIQDDEIFTLDPLQKYTLNKNLFTELIKNQTVLSKKYLNSGMLAEQNSGLIQFDEIYQDVNADYLQLSSHPNFSGPVILEESLVLKEVEINGRIQTFSDKGLLFLNQSNLKGKHLFEIWIQHCFLCAVEKINQCEFYYKDQNKNLKLGSFQVVEKQQAIQIMQQLIAAYFRGKNELLEFYVDTAYEYEKISRQKNPAIALEKITSLWTGDGFTPFYEAQDVYLKTSLKNTAANNHVFSKTFFENSSRLMQPLVDKLVLN